MKIEPKDKFRHFKGNIIEVICIAKNTETLEDIVVYHHNNECWARSLSMFQERVDENRSDNITHQKYRFEKIEEEKL